MTARGAGRAPSADSVVWQIGLDGSRKAALGPYRLAVVSRPSGRIEWSVMARGFVPGRGYVIEYDSADVDDFATGARRAEASARRMLAGREGGRRSGF